MKSKQLYVSKVSFTASRLKEALTFYFAKVTNITFWFCFCLKSCFVRYIFYIGALLSSKPYFPYCTVSKMFFLVKA